MFVLKNVCAPQHVGVDGGVCITQITFKFIDNALLVNYGRLQFRFSQIINDLLARKDWLQFMIEFSSTVAKLFANHIGGFLIFI